MAFSWEAQMKKTEKHNLQRCRLLALSKNPDYLTRYPAEVRDFLTKGKSTECETRIHKQCEKHKLLNKPYNTVINHRFNRSDVTS